MKSLAWRIAKQATFFGALFLVVVLTLQGRQLRDALNKAVEASAAMQPGRLAPQAVVPSTNGDSVLLGVSSEAVQLYFVYNSRCPYCLESLAAWNELASRLTDNRSVRVLGISLDSLRVAKRYQREHSVGYRSAVLLDARHVDAFNFRSVPQTLVLDSTGLVLQARVGVLGLGPPTDSVEAAVRKVLPHDGGR